MSVPPDQAQIDGGVANDARTAREASDANNAAMGKVLLALKGAGIDEKDFQTSRLSLQPQFATETFRAAPADRRLSRQQPRHDPLRDVTKVASMIDVLVGAGANEIGGINFMVSQASKLLDEAREQAISDARRKAQIYARAAGVTLGEPLSISEEGSAIPLFRGKSRRRHRRLAAPIAQGEETLSVTVNVSWAIKPE